MSESEARREATEVRRSWLLSLPGTPSTSRSRLPRPTKAQSLAMGMLPQLKAMVRYTAIRSVARN